MRVTFFDDEIEQLQLFDPLTGHIKQKIGRFYRVSRLALRGAALERAQGGGQDQDELRMQKQFFIDQMKLIERSASSSAPGSISKCWPRLASARALRTTRGT